MDTMRGIEADMASIAAVWTAIVLIVGGADVSAQSGPTGGADLAPQCKLGLFQNQGAGLVPLPGSNAETSPNEALRELATQRQKWQSQQPATYRLCVITVNPLLATITETDVAQGTVRVARHAEGRTAVEGALQSNEWSPDAGLTVEGLFDQIQQGLTRPQDLSGSDRIRFVVEPTYDPRWGYPIRIYSGPDRNSAVHVFDADVMTLVLLTPSPTVPLSPASSGEVYNSQKRGRILRPGAIYDTLLGFISKDNDDRIRLLWPELAAAILKRGNQVYWRQVNWEPQAGMVGNILGTFKHPSGRSLYLMAFPHNGEDIYLPIEIEAVAVSQ